MFPPEFLSASISEPDVGVDECVLSVRWSEPVISCADSVSQYVLSVTPPTSDCQSGSEDCVFMTNQTQYNLTVNASQTYNLTVRADDSCGNMGQPTKYDIDLTGTMSTVAWSVYTYSPMCRGMYMYVLHVCIYKSKAIFFTVHVCIILQLKQESKGTAATVTCMTPPLQK